MANAGTPGEARHLRQRISRTDEKGWRSVRSIRDLERSVLCRIRSLSRRSLRSVLRSVRANRQTGPYNYSNGAEARLLLPVALCLALVASAFYGDSSATCWPGAGDYWFAPSAFSRGRRRKELAATADCGVDRPADRNNARDIYTSRRIYSLESAYERLERRSGTRKSLARRHCTSAARSSRLSGQTMPQLPFAR